MIFWLYKKYIGTECNMPKKGTPKCEVIGSLVCLQWYPLLGGD